MIGAKQFSHRDSESRRKQQKLSLRLCDSAAKNVR